jgi:hypothetical protein
MRPSSCGGACASATLESSSAAAVALIMVALRRWFKEMEMEASRAR